MRAESMAGGSSESAGTWTGAVRPCVLCAMCSCGLPLVTSRWRMVSHHCRERALIPSAPEGFIGLWVVVCGVCGVCGVCAVCSGVPVRRAPF